jgi:hypothetical protein
MFCSECGDDCGDGKFCANCGTKVTRTSSNQSNSESALRAVTEKLNQNWGSEVHVEAAVLNELTVSEWGKLQEFINNKTGNFVRAREWVDYSRWLAASDELTSSYLETMQSLSLSIMDFGIEKRPPGEIWKKVAAIGTVVGIPLGTPQSGSSYFQETLDLAEDELELAKVLGKAIFKRESSHFASEDFFASLDLFSDSARAMIASFLGASKQEIAVLERWAPKPGVLKMDMTAAFVALTCSENVSISPKALINPRMVFACLVDNFEAHPWWMEMGFWSGFSGHFKDELLAPVDIDVDNELMSNLIQNSLNPKLVPEMAAKIFSQDKDVIAQLMDYFSET